MVDGVFDTTLTVEEATANTASLYGALNTLIDSKRSEPGDDMTSLLIASRDEEGDGGGLTDEELRDTLLLMISAGYDTTVNVIDQAITALLTDPAHLAHLRAGRADWHGVVEETLRHEPAVKHLPLRYAVSDIPLPGGGKIARGEAILASYAAANRHPGWHGETADSFDPTRPTKDHLAFGHGVHFCLGAPLARLEVATVLQQFFDRFPDAELAVPAAELKPLPSLISNGHQSLPVRLRPSAKADVGAGRAAEGARATRARATRAQAVRAYSARARGARAYDSGASTSHSRPPGVTEKDQHLHHSGQLTYALHALGTERGFDAS